jgi:AP-1 complex subunit gamma-1
MGSLKTFIKSVRNSKTIAAERAVIRKESAKIRSSFRDVHLDNDKRRKNIQKLLYLYILGEPTYFGQVECLKLIASSRFMDKRVGYMAAMLILDENQDILTLLTNSLDIDLKSSNHLIVGLALCTLGNIASPELAKDLYPNIENLLNSPQSYIKKKAAMVASKLVEKDPMLTDVYLPHIPKLLNEKSHGILLSTCSLIVSIYYNDETSHKQLLQIIPKILSHIKLLSSSGYSPEYDIKGIPDPFLFVALLKTLRILLKNSSDDNNDDINDLLTQICAKFENSKGAGYSILYETVKTIFTINSDSSLKVLGVNILSKFLIQKDNNIRYVALDTLLQVIEFEPLAVQRHRTTIVGCLYDGDISIRRRALELTFSVMNQQNIKLLTKELLNYLKNEDNDELKFYITNQLSNSCHKFNKDLEWNLETLISMLNIAGNFVNDTILSKILSMIMQVNKNSTIIKNILIDLVKTLKNSLYDQYGLSLVTIWCLGEYSDLIIGKSEIHEDSIIEIINSILAVSNYSNNEQKTQIKIYILTACLKLSIKLKKSSNIEILRKIILNLTNDINLEIQSRAIEFMKIFNEPISVKRGLLERMPAPPFKNYENLSLLDRSHNIHSNMESNQEKVHVQPSKTSGDLLLDLLGDNESNSNNSVTVEQQKSTNKNTAIDLLSDIFGTTSIKSTSNNQNNANDILGLSTTNINTATEPDSIEAFNDGNIKVGFVEKNIGNGNAEFETIIKNVNDDNINNVSILCAVPKQQKLQLSSISKTSLKKSEFTIINVKISGNAGSKIKIRVKLSYVLNGTKIDKQFDFAGNKLL